MTAPKAPAKKRAPRRRGQKRAPAKKSGAPEPRARALSEAECMILEPLVEEYAAAKKKMEAALNLIARANNFDPARTHFDVDAHTMIEKPAKEADDG